MRVPAELPTVLDSLGDAVWLLNGEGEVTFANEAARSLLADGGGGDARGSDPGVGEAFGACLDRIRSGEDVAGGRFAVRCAGRRRWYSARLNRYESGSMLIWTDESPIREAEDHLGLFKRAVRDCSQPMCIADCRQRDMPLVFVNSNFETMTGYKSSEAIGRNCRFLQGEERDQQGIEEIRRALARGQSCRVVLKNFRKDGSMFWNELSLSPIRDERGRVTHFLGIQNDVTQLREAKLALITARNAAESADRAKGEFLAVMSHEIRTPMQSVFGFTDLLLATPLNDEQRRFVSVIRSQSDALLAILNDILDFSRLQSGAVKLEAIPFGVREVLDDIMATFKGAAESKGLGLEVALDGDLPRWVIGDAARLRQILMNLVSNAIKFTDHGKVTIAVVAARGTLDGKRDVTFEVTDTGRGISKEQLPQLFQSFSQLETADVRTHGGTGLGLAITKKLAELMGGSVGVRSRPGKGSTFWARLPFEPVAEGADAPEARHGEAGGPADLDFARRHPLSILLVEDNTLTAEVACSYLRWMGYNPDHADRAVTAIEAARRTNYDVVLMDLQMPDIDGIEAGRMIRATYGQRHRPQMVALTANAMAGERERCLSAGLDDYLTKPINVGTLRSALLAAEARLHGRVSERRRVRSGAHERNGHHVPVVDLASLDEMEQLSAGSAVKMIDLMHKEAPEHIIEIKATVNAKEADALGRAAHKFKGGCAVLGARRLERACTAIINAATQGNVAAAAKVAATLDEEWRLLAAELDNLKERLNARD